MSQTYFAKGNRLFRENRLEEAVREYRRALKQQETFYAYENLGMALERLQREAEARRAYTESLRLNARAVRAARYLEQHGVPVPAPPKGKRAAPASPSAPQGKPPAPEEVHPVEMIRQASRAIDVAPLKADYHRQGLDQVADTFCLVRVVGNDLYPRHKKGQSRENVRFILDNEPDYPGLTKLWIVNRIVDPSEREAILALLAAHGQAFLEISFDAERYAHLPFDTDSLPDVGYLNSAAFSGVDALARNRAITATYRLKNNYVMNNNGARNVALAEARKRAKWALPWDGNCYLTPDAWQAIQQDVTAAPWFSHFVVPMARMLSNDDLISNAAPPDPVEEPQLIFRCDTDETFNEAFCYGRRPKVELFWALGIPGKWDRWKDDPWDLTRRDLLPGARRFALAGWVARLYSGMGSLEQNTQESFKNRGRIRQDAIIATLRHLDKRLARGRAYPQACQFFQQADLKRLRRDYRQGEDRTLVAYVERLLADAEEALQRGPYSVVEKTTLPPSGDRHDYWHPAPYWWPDPDKPDGLPYIRRDGERVPGTRLYEPESDKYDRTRLQRVFDDSTALMLAWHFTGERRYAEHAARIFERFFIAPQTRMNPHLNYAQVRMGHGNNLGASTGIIEFKDFYYYLDAVRLLEQAKVLEPEAFDEFRAWLGEYQTWLLESPQGRKECQGANNHGTYYDLHLAAVAAYLGDEETLYDTLVRAQGRIAQQVTDTGEQPDELSRTTSQHYCHYNLQGFLSLALLARNWGVDLLHYEAQGGASLKKAVAWLLERAGRAWEHQQIDAFDAERSYPIYHFARALGDAARQELETSAFALKGRFFPHDGIAPYWQLMTPLDGEPSGRHQEQTLANQC